MDPQNLKAFTAVAETGSFSEAAELLSLTQPAISKRIASLELDLHNQLFDRIGRKVSLTEAGRALLPRAQRILFEIADTERALSNLSGKVEGRLSMGTSHHIGLHRLPPVLREYSQRFPDVQLDMKFIDSEQAFDSVSQGEMELGVVTLPPKIPGHVHTEVIWEDPLTVLVNEEHPLAAANRSAPVTLQDLASYPGILPSQTTFTRRIVEKLFRDQNLDIEVAISTNYLETIKMMVSIGLGWSVLPASMMDDSVCQLSVLDCRLSRNLGVVFHPNHSLSNAAKAMLDLLTRSRTAPG
ncbi:MAG: LysR family transcriptional regulator [Ketobacteraceae bacterium]|nr:LysR family transcriptional regulator [Ketobacteraceae bacterium]